MSRDKLKHRIRQQFLSRDKFIVSFDINFMLHLRLHYTVIGKQEDAVIDVFLL